MRTPRATRRPVLRPAPLIGAALLGLAAPHAAAQDTVRVVVVATTDVHGRAFHWDYVRDREAPGGLTRVATVVDSLRQQYPGGVVVLDAGDLIQGNPFATYFATERPVTPHPVVDALNAVGYDAATLGNHEFDFGLDVLARATGSAAFPIVSGNIYRLPRDTFAYQPYTVLRRGDVRIAVTGFTTPGTMVWDRAHVSNRVLVRRILPAAERVVALPAVASADLRIVLAHTGFGGPSSYDTTGVGAENVAAGLAALSVRPHLVVVGHTHRSVRDTLIRGVHFLQPPAWARGVAVVHVWLVRGSGSAERGAGTYRVARVVGEQVMLDGVRPDPSVTRRLDIHHGAVQSWAATPLARLEGDWSAQYARAQDTPLIDFINELQRRRAGAQLSATAAFDPSVGLGRGEVRLRDVAGVYPYENTLKAVRISGAGLKEYLERSARYFRTYRPGESMIDPRIPGYNFDMVSGVEYVIDLTRPAGQRIRQVTHRGQLVRPDDVFILALNNYRQSGGGGFEMLAGLPVVYDQGESIRDLLVEYLRQVETLRASDFYRPSWQIIPPEAAAGVRATFERGAESRW